MYSFKNRCSKVPTIYSDANLIKEFTNWYICLKIPSFIYLFQTLVVAMMILMTYLESMAPCIPNVFLGVYRKKSITNKINILVAMHQAPKVKFMQKTAKVCCSFNILKPYFIKETELTPKRKGEHV